jgi:hypothetical protein
MEMHPPLELVDWLVQNAMSNVELASISNVCHEWRNRAMHALAKPSSSNHNNSVSSALLLPSMLASETTAAVTFCAAWLPPEGIQSFQVPLDSDSDDDDDDDDETLFAPSGAQSYPLDQQEYRQHLLRSNSSSPAPTIKASHEWMGYSKAWEVLEPFGYARVFVEQTLLLAAKERSINESAEDECKTIANGTTANKSRSSCYKYKCEKYTPTLAVRGATFARPEGYCLCWDSDGQFEEAQLDTLSRSDNDVHKDMRQQELSRALHYSKKKRRVLQQDYLPRVLMSSATKDSLSATEGGQHPCLQFLNSSGNNAVRMHTPPFDCGTLRGPITMFCVGIATEDGCFVSGLKRRCELGHMYPTNGRDDLIDMSPICIATDKVPENQEDMMEPRKGFAADDSSCDSDSEEQQRGQDQTTSCDCPFDSVPGPDDPEDEREPVNEAFIYRGKRGPGSWHCYVAVFGGHNSMIRIDGMTEPLPSNKPGDERAIALDGLTIGSDHCFDMTLCYGEGCDEEGEGAISELAVFQGRLCMSDIEQLEGHLMKKHGIRRGNPGIQSFLFQEDELRRQARALIAQPFPYQLSGQVPLSIVAQDRSVAWKRVNAVTGKSVNIGRIGSKFSTGSSDW